MIHSTYLKITKIVSFPKFIIFLLNSCRKLDGTPGMHLTIQRWDILEWFFNTVLEFLPWMLWTQKKAKSNSKPQASFQEVSMFCRRQLFSDAIVDALIRNIVSNWHLGRSRWKEGIYKKKELQASLSWWQIVTNEGEQVHLVTNPHENYRMKNRFWPVIIF